MAMVAALGVPTPTALGYEFGPTVRQIGPEQTVFDWSTMRCEDINIPDSPARAFRDASNQVQLTLSHYVNYRMIGPSLNSLSVDCSPTMLSDANADPAAYDDKEWIGAPYTLDGTTVRALIIDEYHGWEHPGQCSSQGHPSKPRYTVRTSPIDGEGPNCWYNSITLGTSTDAGATYTHATPPSHLVASVPYQYVPDQPPYGYFLPSNIIRNRDNYYYALMHTETYGAQQVGVCVMRTRNLADPTSWRGWDGTGFNVQFINPYIDPGPPENHVCTPLAYDKVQKMTESLTYNTFFKKFLLLGMAIFNDPKTGEATPGVYYTTSADLITWSTTRLVMKVEFPWTWECGDDNPVLNGAVLNPSTTRNFEITGQKTYLYFTRFNFDTCVGDSDRDLVRIPIEFLATTPGPTTEGP
jgi:hypothetical protein